MWVRDKLLNQWASVDKQGHVEWAAEHRRTPFTDIADALRAATDLAFEGPCHPVIVRQKKMRQASRKVLRGTAGPMSGGRWGLAGIDALLGVQVWLEALPEGTKASISLRTFEPEP